MLSHQFCCALSEAGIVSNHVLRPVGVPRPERKGLSPLPRLESPPDVPYKYASRTKLARSQPRGQLGHPYPNLQ